MSGRIITCMGVLGILAAIIVAVTTFSSKDLLFAPFIVIGLLLGIIIIALGELLYFFQKNKNRADE